MTERYRVWACRNCACTEDQGSSSGRWVKADQADVNGIQPIFESSAKWKAKARKRQLQEIFPCVVYMIVRMK